LKKRIDKFRLKEATLILMIDSEEDLFDPYFQDILSYLKIFGYLKEQNISTLYIING